MSANCEECVYYDYDEELAAGCLQGPGGRKWSSFSVAAIMDCPSTGPAMITARLVTAVSTTNHDKQP